MDFINKEKPKKKKTNGFFLMYLLGLELSCLFAGIVLERGLPENLGYLVTLVVIATIFAGMIGYEYERS